MTAESKMPTFDGTNVELRDAIRQSAGSLKEQVCSICPNPSSYRRTDCLGSIHRACVEHEPYLEGWVRDVASEVRSENRAAGDFEDREHGDDY